MIHDSRLRVLNDADTAAAPRVAYVLYWMQASQRAHANHALEYAIRQANELGLPVLVGFGLMDNYPEANARHYAFMLEGLADAGRALRKRGIRFVVRHGSPPKVAVELARNAALVVCDRGYLNVQKRWRDEVADGAGRRVVQIETDVVVPAEEVSDHHEFAARTIRPKIHRLLGEYLKPVAETKPKRRSLDLTLPNDRRDLDWEDPAKLLAKLKVDRSVGPSPRFAGGTAAGRKVLAAFIGGKLAGYDEGRNEPAAAGTSTMAPYLHFGQLSPLEIALTIRDAPHIPAADREAYLEELIVRRELSVNFCHFEPRYDRYEALPAWARKTLAEHRRDKRYHVYTRQQLESADTHDPYWNAAQREMLRTGFMHNYMRMYWGKKVLEWKQTPEEAFEEVLYLNNKYFLCGRDPNAYANVAWIFGLHDRPWGPARPVFGTVRYMNATGLERKFDMDAYVKQNSE